LLYEMQSAVRPVDTSSTEPVDSGVARALGAVATLPPLEQRVIVSRFGLFEQDELRINQVAERLNLAPAVVRSVERRALRSLRRTIAHGEAAA